MMSPTPGGSTLMTSAPRSPRSWPANGPAMNAPSSSTRRPASGVSLTGRTIDSDRPGGRNGLCTERPLRRAEGEAYRLRPRRRATGGADLPGAARGVGRPAFPPTGHGGTEDGGAQARPLEHVSAGERPRVGPHQPRVRAVVRGDGHVALVG